jgi:ParB-like chromosome segregation protein Spo0J
VEGHEKVPEFHPAANLLPLLEGLEFEALVRDIRTHGLCEPITLLEGVILDGRNRYRACKVAGIEPRFEQWVPRHQGDTPLAFVLSRNLERRHLNESQRAMSAARMANLPDGMRQDHAQGASIEAPTSQVEAAQRLKVSRPSIQRATKVLKQGASGLVAAVDRGLIRVSTASILTNLSAAEQLEAATADDPQRAALRVLRQSRKRKEASRAVPRSLEQVLTDLVNIPSMSMRSEILLVRDRCTISSGERAKLAGSARAAAARLINLAGLIQAPDVCAYRHCNRASGGSPRQRCPGEKYCSKHCAEQADDRAGWHDF